MLRSFKYIIVGGGLAGASAIEGIREIDRDGSILLIGGEKHLPYDRPPLTKKLWFGKKKVEDIFLHNKDFYEQNGVELGLGLFAESLDIKNKSVTDSSGAVFQYEKILLATGGTPRIMSVPGADEIRYYRTLDDYSSLRAEASAGKSAVVIGGGFIGSEIAAALNMNNVKVTMVFPNSWLVNRVFPESLGRSLNKTFGERGIQMLTNEKPAAFSRKGRKFLTRTESGKEIESDIVIAGVGIALSLDLPRKAGLQTANGIIVNEYLEASLPGIYAAGDIAFFPYKALGKQMHVEHWDNALNQGKLAGRNMAGAHEAYDYMPYFFSDLFEFGYEAVGDINSSLETVADWEKENDTGTIYYIRDGKVRGAMMCNVWDKVPAARELILRGEHITKERLHKAVA